MRHQFGGIGLLDLCQVMWYFFHAYNFSYGVGSMTSPDACQVTWQVHLDLNLKKKLHEALI
jgi:hypothetical protein